ncbi:MAG: NAD(P)H-hydrate dehydratase [Actinomycetota bacterium]|nr:NAD(P)H-hydrate dehydratase [Actinomycetota bacterium]
MIVAYTVEQLRAAETVALGLTPDGTLMQRAATVVAVTALSRLPSPVPGSRVVLLVGTGNNGGDALYAGAMLRSRGVVVTAVLVSPDRAHAGALVAFRRAGGRIVEFVGDGGDAGDSVLAPVMSAAALVIDGLVGIGGRPPLRPAAARLVGLVNASEIPVLAVDVPSGIDPDLGDATEGGSPSGASIRAAITVTFGAPSTGLLATRSTGKLVVADLGLAPPATVPPDAVAFDDVDVELLRPRPGLGADKYSGGVLGVVAGSDRYPGAAVLAVGAAVRLRPGLVRYAGPGAAAVLDRWPEVVAAADPAEAGRVQAWLAGPGMGTDGAALARLGTVLQADVPAVIDADALTMLAANPTLLSRRTRPAGNSEDGPADTVLTPHAGEFGRLWPDLDPADRVTSARSAARQSDAVVLLKGDRTVIAAPDGRTAVNLSGSGWLATAGSGDVLSGIIGSLLAAGLDPFAAAAVGAQLHGRAGERAQAAGRAGAQALWDYLN